MQGFARHLWPQNVNILFDVTFELSLTKLVDFFIFFEQKHCGFRLAPI